MPSHTHQVLLPRERQERLVVWQALHPEIPLQALLQSPPLAETKRGRSTSFQVAAGSLASHKIMSCLYEVSTTAVCMWYVD